MALYKDVLGYSVAELADWLQTQNSEELNEDIITTIETSRINGKTFVDLNERDLAELFPILGDRKAISRLVASLKPTSLQPQLLAPRNVSF